MIMWVVTWYLPDSTDWAVFRTPSSAWTHAKKVKKLYRDRVEVEVRWEVSP